MNMSLPFRKVKTAAPLSKLTLQRWIKRELGISNYEMVQTTTESITGRLLALTPFVLDVECLQKITGSDTVVLLITVFKESSSAISSVNKQTRPSTASLYIAGAYSKKLLLKTVTSVGNTLCLQQLCVESPYVYSGNDRLPRNELPKKRAIQLASDRLRLIASVRDAKRTPKEVAEEAERLFHNREEDTLSLHLAIACLSSTLSNTLMFAESEARLLEERMLLRGLTPKNEPEVHQQRIAQDLLNISMRFECNPLKDTACLSIVHAALQHWH